MTNQLAGRKINGFAAFEKGAPLQAWSFQRRALRSDDVELDILYVGICHSDIHAVKDGWGQEFPLVPGHEIVGKVTAIGSTVTEFKTGDVVAIGVIVDSCRECQPCKDEMEVYCRNSPTSTYDGIDRIDKTRTRGGFSESYVADKRFVFLLPPGLNPAAAAPLLCAGITTYSPLKHWKIGPGKTAGVVGIGGLGHLGVKFARALGAHVVAFTTSSKKEKEAFELGAHEVVLSTDAKQMEAQAYRFDFILDTVSKRYPMNAMMTALKIDGTLCSLGIPDSFEVSPFLLASGRRSLASSGAGGTKETKEMLAFCAEHGILPEVEMIAPSEINQALGRLEKGDVRYRFVIDMSRGK